MKKAFAGLWVLAAVLLIFVAAQAQEAPKEATTTTKTEKTGEPKPQGAYKLEFVLRELQDGKVINSRNYMMIMEGGYRNADVKIGSRIPIKTEQQGVNYIDLGTNVSCHHLEEHPPFVMLECSFEVSSFSLPEERASAGANAPPVLSQMRASVPAWVQEGKQTTITSIDDPSSTKRYEIAVTATKIK